MRRGHRSALRALLLLLVLGGVAAGLIAINESGDVDEAPPAGPTSTTADLTAAEAEVANLVQEAAETRTADDCARLATPKYLAQREHLYRGATSLAACQDDVFDVDEGLLDEPVEVVGVDDVTQGPNGSKGVALVRHAAGSDWAGLTARIRVTADRLAVIKGFIEPDRGALEHAIRVTLIEGPPALPKKVADCAVQSLRGSPDAALAAALVEASPRSLYSPAIACDTRAVIDRAMTGVPERFPFLPPAAIACAASQVETFATVQLLQFVLLRDERPALAAALDCDRRGAMTRYAAQLRSGPYKLPRKVLSCVLRRLDAKSSGDLVAVFTTKGVDEITAACGYRPPQG